MFKLSPKVLMLHSSGKGIRQFQLLILSLTTHRRNPRCNLHLEPASNSAVNSPQIIHANLHAPRRSCLARRRFMILFLSQNPSPAATALNSAKGARRNASHRGS